MSLTVDTVRLPPGWGLVVSVDTGTYMSALFCGVSPDPSEAYALVEIPNYTYIAGEYELLGLTIAEWASRVVSTYRALSPGSKPFAWCDPNSQFKTECLHHGLILRSNKHADVLRTEISREYFQLDRIHLAPWLDVLPQEIENACWPPEETAAGHFKRLKEKDHTLDCLEHCLSRRPITKRQARRQKPTFVENYLTQHRNNNPRPRRDTHLGSL